MLSRCIDDRTMYFGNVTSQRLEHLKSGEETSKINICISSSESIRNQTLDDIRNRNFICDRLQNHILISHSKNVKSETAKHISPTVIRLSRHSENKMCPSESNIQPLDHSYYCRNYQTSTQDMHSQTRGNSLYQHKQNNNNEINVPCKQGIGSLSAIKEVEEKVNYCSEVVKNSTDVEIMVHDAKTKLVPSESENDRISREVVSLMLETVECFLDWDNYCSAVVEKSTNVKVMVHDAETKLVPSESENDRISREVVSLMLETVECFLDWDNYCSAVVENSTNVKVIVHDAETKLVPSESENDRISREVVSLMLETVECFLDWENAESNFMSQTEDDQGVISSTNDQGAISSTNDQGAISSTNDQGAISSTNFSRSLPKIDVPRNTNKRRPKKRGKTLRKHSTKKHLNKTFAAAKVKAGKTVESVHTPCSNKKVLECKSCNCYFSEQAELKVHALIHLKERRLSCNVCGTTFKKYKDLDEHSLLHNTKPTCEICGKKFTTAGYMRTHLRIHTKEKPYKCEHCGKSYTQAGDLKTHVRKHTGERPYLCEHCGTFFQSSSHLARHSKVHTKEKPFKCDVCGRSFGHGHHLKKHYRIHTKEKPYMCEICSKVFSRPDYLQQHIRIHTKEKPYECRICGKAFSQGGSLMLHQRTHSRKDSISLTTI